MFDCLQDATFWMIKTFAIFEGEVRNKLLEREQELANYCQPCEAFQVTVRRYEKPEPGQLEETISPQYVCTMCPHCRQKLFDLEVAANKGSCLGCGFKTNNYEESMRNSHS